MSTTGKVFPLESFLLKFKLIWNYTDKLFILLLGQQIFNLIFRTYSWGGFTYVAILWSIKLIINQDLESNSHIIDDNIIRGRKLILAYILFFAITIILNINQDNWVPYVQEPDWVINVKHKQQISAGTYLIVYIIILTLSYSPESKGYKGSLKFLSSWQIITYTFLLMNLDNFASFSWFPGIIDPTNKWINGYEEIFMEGQNLYSIDKLYHFAMSSTAILIILMYVNDDYKAITIAILVVVFWELFEISLNPKESSDSLLDMLFNTSAFIITDIIYRKIIKFNNIAIK